MTGPARDAPIPELDEVRTTSDVGSEGGSPGDVELDRSGEVGTGSEAGETWRPTAPTTREVRRDETGVGRRSPEGDSER